MTRDERERWLVRLYNALVDKMQQSPTLVLLMPPEAITAMRALSRDQDPNRN